MISEIPYEGGYVAIPEFLIGTGESALYMPRPEHDLLALVLVINTMMFPCYIATIQSHLVLDESSVQAMALKNGWDRCFDK